MSLIRVDNFGPSAGGTTYSARGIAKVWWQFDQYYTNTIVGSLNVSSGVDGGTGVFLANFTNSMSDASYSVANSLGGNNSYGAIYSYDVGTDFLSSSLRGLIRQTASPTVSQDAQRVMAEIHGDLA